RILLRIWRRYRDTALFVKMTVGFVLGLIVAFVFGEQAQVLSPLGDILLNLLQLIVIPIIMVTLIDAVNSTRPGNLVRVAFKTFAFYILTTIAAVVISLALALLINPGTGLHRPEKSAETPDAPSFVDQLVGIFPDNLFKALPDGNILPPISVSLVLAVSLAVGLPINPRTRLHRPEKSAETPDAPSFVDQLVSIFPDTLFKALADGNSLALIFVSMVIGLTLAGMRRSTEETISGFEKLVYDLVLAAKEMTFRILAGILQYAPFGVLALVASDIGSQGLDALTALGKLTGVVYAGLAAQILIIYIPLLLINRIPVGGFFRVAGAPM